MWLLKNWNFSIGVLICFCCALGVRAGGFGIPDQDAFAIARGMAFVATADNPSAIYYNPAGITQLDGHNVRAGLYGLHMETEYEPTSGGSYRNEREDHLVPQLFYTFSPENERFSLGIGMFAPFGLSSRWPDDTGFRTIATQGSIDYRTINPVIALEILPELSLGAGLTFNYSSLDLQRGLVWPSQPYDLFKFRGDGWDVGYNFGLMWRPVRELSFGLSYRSATTVELDGDSTYTNSVAVPPSPPYFPGIPAFPQQTVESEATFPFPSKLIVGVSYRPSSKWNLEANVDYTSWDRVRTVNIQQRNRLLGILPQQISVALNWKSSWFYEFGVTRYMNNGWSVSAGYIYNENSLPDDNYSPLVGDLNRHFLTIGTGYKVGQLQVDLAYEFGYGPTRQVSGSAPSATGQTADGDYEFRSHALAASVGWHF
jgi:long-chain fatty acid transport protein